MSAKAERAKSNRPSRLRDSATKGVVGFSGSANVHEDEDDSESDEDVLLLAKSYFDVREYRRAAHALQGASGKKAFFLRCYATYLVMCSVNYFFHLC